MVDNYQIGVVPGQRPTNAAGEKLFFLNLGGYKANEFDEFHYKMLVVCKTLEEAKKRAYQTAFYKHTALPETAHYKKAIAHIDDKYGIDVDDAYVVEDILPAAIKENYFIRLSPAGSTAGDVMNLGYLTLSDII
jgi:hypothetical protein